MYDSHVISQAWWQSIIAYSTIWMRCPYFTQIFKLWWIQATVRSQIKTIWYFAWFPLYLKYFTCKFQWYSGIIMVRLLGLYYPLLFLYIKNESATSVLVNRRSLWTLTAYAYLRVLHAFSYICEFTWALHRVYRWLSSDSPWQPPIDAHSLRGCMTRTSQRQTDPREIATYTHQVFFRHQSSSNQVMKWFLQYRMPTGIRDKFYPSPSTPNHVLTGNSLLLH